jgi:hypothetical protein
MRIRNGHIQQTQHPHTAKRWKEEESMVIQYKRSYSANKQRGENTMVL